MYPGNDAQKDRVAKQVETMTQEPRRPSLDRLKNEVLAPIDTPRLYDLVHESLGHVPVQAVERPAVDEPLLCQRGVPPQANIGALQDEATPEERRAREEVQYREYVEPDRETPVEPRGRRQEGQEGQRNGQLERGEESEDSFVRGIGRLLRRGGCVPCSRAMFTTHAAFCCPLCAAGSFRELWITSRRLSRRRRRRRRRRRVVVALESSRPLDLLSVRRC